MLRSCSWWISALGLKKIFFNHPVRRWCINTGGAKGVYGLLMPLDIRGCFSSVPHDPVHSLGRGVALGQQAVGVAADWSAPRTTQKECPTAMAPWQQVPRRPKTRLAPSLHDWASTCPTQIGQVQCGSWTSKLDRYWTFWLKVKITCETLQIGHWLNVSCWFLIEKNAI